MNTKCFRITLTILVMTGLSASSLAAVIPVSDDFSSDTSGNWVSVGTTNTTIVYDSTTEGDYDDGDPASKLSYTVGMTLTGDGISDLNGSDGGLRLNTVDAVEGNEAIGLTINGTMEQGNVIVFSGSVYNDNSSFSKYIAQLWNLTDDTLLAESASISVDALSHVAYVPRDFSVSYKVTAADNGDTLQIRFKEDNNSNARDIYVDNVSVTSTPEILYAYEDFFGIIGEQVDSTGATGSGFTVTNTNFRMQYKTGLEYTDSLGNVLQTQGNAAGMTNIVAGTQNLQLSLNTLSSGVVYASYLLELEAGTGFGLMTGLQTAPVGDSDNPITSIAAGFRSTSSNFGSYSDTGGIDERTGPGSSPYAVSNLLVIIEAGLDNDELTVWLNPTNLTDVAGSAAYTMSGTGSDIGSVSSFLVSLGGLEQATVDEIRIGNTLDAVLPLVDPNTETLLWNFNLDTDPVAEDIAQYDYTSDQVYVGSNAVANTLAFNGRSSGTDYWIADKGAGHEKALFFRTINTANTDFGVYMQKLDFRVDNRNLTNQTRVSWSFDILGSDHAGIEPTNWTVKINTGNYSENLNVSDGWFNDENSVTAQTFDFVDDDSTWTTVTGSYVIAVNQAGSAGGIQIGTDTGGYTSSDGIYLDNIQVTIESITPVYDNALEEWAAAFGLYGDNALPGNDAEPDGLDNLMEYALGGNPATNDAAAVAPVAYTAEDNGTNWFYHVHNQRTDDPSLTFTLGTETDLVDAPAWNANDVFSVGESAVVDGFKTVTNRTEMTDNTKFIRLKIEQD